MYEINVLPKDVSAATGLEPQYHVIDSPATYPLDHDTSYILGQINEQCNFLSQPCHYAIRDFL